MNPVKRTILKIPIHFVLFPFLLFVIVPAFLLKNNIEDLADFEPKAFLLLAAFAVLASVVLLLIKFLLVRVYAGTHFSRFVEFSCFFVVITGFVLPVSIGPGMEDPWLLQIHEANVVLAIALASILMFLSLSKVRRRLYAAVIVFIAINAATTIPAIYSLKSKPDSIKSSIFNISNNRNIFVLSFDGISGSMVVEVLEEHEELNSSFAGFVFYDRVTSSSPATSASTATSLYGNRNFKKRYQSIEQLWDSAPEKLLTNSLNANGYDVSTYGIYNKKFVEPTRRHSRIAPQNPPSVLSLLSYSIARTLTRFFVIRGDLVERLDNMITRMFSPLNDRDFELMREISSSFSPQWKKGRLTPTVLDFREYVEKLHVSSAKPVAHFLHFTYTHFPVEFDRHCDFLGHKKAWFEKHQNRQGAKEEVYCALNQYSQFLEKLKVLNAFDDSLIILKSDHGKPVKYNDTGRIESFKIRENPFWGYGRYRPFLAIKNFGANRQNILHDSNPVILDDLAKSLCVNSRINVECGAYNGYDLLGYDFSRVEDSEVTIFVAKSSKSNFRYDSHDGITINRGTDILESLHSTLSAEVLNSNVKCDQQIRVKGAPKLNNGYSDFASWLTWTHRKSSFLRFRQERKCKTAKLMFEIKQERKKSSEVAILVNGQVIIAPTYLEEGDSSDNSNTMVVKMPTETFAATRDILIEIRLRNSEIGGLVEILGMDFNGSLE